MSFRKARPSKPWVARPSKPQLEVCLCLAVGACVVATAAIGCDDPLTLPQRIERTRVLAARVEVTAEPTNAWPAPGQDAVIRWLVVDPEPSIGFTWDLRACVAGTAAVGLPSCASAPFAAQRSEVATGALPSLSLTAPPITAGREGDEVILVHGVICARGIPSEDAGGCVGTEADGDRVALSIPLGGTGENNNPSLDDDTITLGGIDWLEPGVVGGDGCAADAGSSALPLIHAGDERAIELELRGPDRERIDTQEPSFGGEGAWETLQVAYFATGGTLDRPFSYIESDAPVEGQRVSVAWSAPGSAPEVGVLVRFYFVVRDLRGGSDWARRDVCVVP
jgi:hypothetical protein